MTKCHVVLLKKRQSVHESPAFFQKHMTGTWPANIVIFLRKIVSL